LYFKTRLKHVLDLFIEISLALRTNELTIQL